MKDEAKKDETAKLEFIRKAAIACAPAIYSDANSHPNIDSASVAKLAFDLAESLWAEYEKRHVPQEETASTAATPETASPMTWVSGETGESTGTRRTTTRRT